MRFDVVTMGSATRDVFATTAANTITFCKECGDEKMLAYPLGSKILIERLDFQIGGGGTNTACTFARQGLKTGFIGKIGKDTRGKVIISWLKKEGITFLGALGGMTGYSVVLDTTGQHDRTILTYKGCNDELLQEELNLNDLDANWFYCSSMIGRSHETMRTIMKTLKSQGANVAFNPSGYQARRGLGRLQSILDHVHVLILNKEEACLLVGKQSEDEEELCQVLAAAGPHTVIITDGEHGVTLFNGELLLRASPIPSCRIHETTGAGDAFGSGFIAGLARGLETKTALLLGMNNAEHVIAELGAKNHILQKEEADACVKADHRKISQKSYK